MTTPSHGPCLEDLARVPRFNSPRLLLVVARSGALACTDFQAGPAATVTGPAGVAMPPVSLGRAPAVPARGRHPGRVGAVARPDAGIRACVRPGTLASGCRSVAVGRVPPAVAGRPGTPARTGSAPLRVWHAASRPDGSVRALWQAQEGCYRSCWQC